jgi:rhodanese-related sulfurtransferase
MRTLVLLLTLLTVPAVFAQTPTAPEKASASKVHELSRAELDELLKKPEKLLLVDVRRPDEVTKIGGFPVYLSVQLADLESRLASIPKDRLIVTVSNHAARAKKAADILTAKGYKVAGAVGAETYEKDGGTITHLAPPPAAANAGDAAATAPHP